MTSLSSFFSRGWLRIGLAGLGLFFFTSEVGLRIAGVTDFPVFYVDSAFGYAPVPSQSGLFLNHNRWSFNDRSMSTDAAWNASLHPNLLLIGNSVVQGGNPIDQADKLGTVLQADLGNNVKVWPIAAGGWSNLNEINFLARFNDVALSADFFVWEYMAGGLSEVSAWRGEYLTPTSHPWLVSWYVARRYVLPRLVHFDESELPPTGSASQQSLSQFDAELARLSDRSKHAVPGIIFLYPESCRLNMARRGEEWLPERTQIEAIAAHHGIMVVDVARDPQWTPELYRDPVHPTVEGNRILARILATSIRSAMGPHAAFVTPINSLTAHQALQQQQRRWHHRVVQY